MNTFDCTINNLKLLYDKKKSHTQILGEKWAMDFDMQILYIYNI